MRRQKSLLLLCSAFGLGGCTEPLVPTAAAPSTPEVVAGEDGEDVAGEDVVVQAAIEPGRYRFGDAGLEFLGPAERLSQTEAYDEIVVSGETPVEGTHLLRQSDEICKVYSYEPVLGADGRSLTPRARKLVAAIQAGFTLAPARRSR